MSDQAHIKASFIRIAEAMARRPSLGQGTGVSTARVTSGLTCEIREGPWHVIADMPVQAGGNGAAPTPGVFGRAALGSCLAIAYTMYAAKLGVPLAAIEVQIQADFDDGALFGVSAVAPGYSEVRYLVTVESDAPEADILRFLDEADAHDPYLDVFSRAQPCRREVRISPPEVGSHG